MSNNIYEELDEAKAEIEKLKAELRGKTDSLKQMKKSHDAHVNQIHEAISKVEKLEQELFHKANEIIYTQDHRWHLNSEESNIKNLSAVNDKLGEDCDENEFKSGMKDWEFEKSALLEEISSLQSKLDSHIRMSQDLQNQLEMCKQSLAHEESERKHLEVEVSDLKVEFNNVSSEYNNAKYSAEKLEQENHELRKSIRELQEAQIHEAKASYSLSVLRSNLRGLEQTYRECVAVFKARQAEWSFLKAQLIGTIDNCQSDLETKAETIEELKMELECSDSLTTELILQNEEMSVMLLVLKQGISVAQLKLSNDNEPYKHREMLEESTKCQMENEFKEKLKEVCGSLDKANTELDEVTCERSEIEFELQMWKSIVERLKNDLEQNFVLRQALEYSLIAQVDFSESLKHDKDELVCELEEEENMVNNLQQELKVKETKSFVLASGATVMSSEAADRKYLQIIEEKDKNLKELQKEVLRLELESFKREFETAVIERGNMERMNELEKENHFQFIKSKNTTIDKLMKQSTLLEKEFISSLTPFTSQLAEKLAEIFQVQEACEKITEAEALAALELEEKKLMIEELEDDIHDMEQKLKLQEEDLSQLKHLALDIEMEMDEKQLKIKELSDQMENKLRGSDVLLQKIKMENRNFLENATTKLSPERENLLSFVMGLSDKISHCTTADTRLIDVLRTIVQSLEKDCIGMNFRSDDGLLVKENMTVHSPRSPFKEINN